MNDKKKSKRFNKKLGGTLLIVVVCAICLNFLGMYVYKSAKKDSNYVNYDTENVEIAGCYNDKNGNQVCPPGMPEEAIRHSSEKENYKPTAVKTKWSLKTNAGNKRKPPNTTSTKVAAVRNRDENFEGVEIGFDGSPYKEYKDGECGDKACTYQSMGCTKTPCQATLKAIPKDSDIRDDQIGWIKNGKLTDYYGSNVLIVADSSYDVWEPCVVGRTCPKKNNGSGSGDNDDTPTPTPTPTPTKKTSGAKKTNNYPNKVNKEVWATDGEYGGSKINCGDKLYITGCNNDADPICKVTKINGKSVKNTFIKKSHYVENEADTGCYQNATRYVQKDNYYYTDSDLSRNKKKFPCGDQVTLKKTMEVACNDKSCEVEYNGKIIYLPKDALITYKPTCSSDPDGKCNSSDKQTDVVGNITIKICNSDLFLLPQ